MFSSGCRCLGQRTSQTQPRIQICFGLLAGIVFKTASQELPWGPGGAPKAMGPSPWPGGIPVVGVVDQVKTLRVLRKFAANANMTASLQNLFSERLIDSLGI